MQKRILTKIYLILGIILIVLGVLLLTSSFRGITGRVVSENILEKDNVRFSGVSFIFAGIFSLFLFVKRKVKGQAAIEFLLTYGWAILASVIVLGVLAFFGVFNPGSYIGNSAFLSPPFYLNAWSVTDSEINLEIRNSGPEDVVIQEVVVGFDEGSCTYSSPEVPIQSGKMAQVTISCELAEGKTFNGAISVKYRKSSSQLPQTISGTIKDKVGPPSSPPASMYSLTINIVGGGTVSCNGGACNSEYSASTVITLIATPDDGREFLGWEGGPCEGPVEQECVLTMNSDKEATALFT